MAIILGILTLILVAIIVIQVSRLSELNTAIRGEKEVEFNNSKTFGYAMLGLLAFVLILSFGNSYMAKDTLLVPASAEFIVIQKLFNQTLFFTGIVFVITHILLFWFSYKYRLRKNPNVLHFADSTKLEIWWTAVPAIVLTYLVVNGLIAWNKIMSPKEELAKNAIEVEATGYQFAWALRYPGKDGKLGSRDFRKIGGGNTLGQDWMDKANLDDIMPNELVLPVNKLIRVRITARDVLHNFYLPQFGVKMDAVPGMPTQFYFTPVKTTEEMRVELNNPNFEYELACAELCGRGHFSMRKVVKVVSQAEYEKWLSEQDSYYNLVIKGSDDDPHKVLEAKMPTPVQDTVKAKKEETVTSIN